MNEPPATSSPDQPRTILARALYDSDQTGGADSPAWDDSALDRAHPGLRERYLQRADALVAGPLARYFTDAAARSAVEEELRVLRRQRMAPERERELLAANNRMLARAEAAEAARAVAEEALATMQRERDVAREAEAFWQQFAFDADDLATGRLLEQTEARAAAERVAIQERCRRERAEGALRLFADRADVMPKEGWASELAKANRDIPLWWFHAARAALDPPDSTGGT
ncbi:MAG: hypothetical protein INR70_27655 [Parafilimonas terrae]|nr:hypothetical protein [Parafilimonas terrae]